MADVEHSGLTDPFIHEPKGVAAATAGDVYVADGAASGTMKDTSEVVRMGIYDYADLATATTPITLSPLNTYVELTNDGLGAGTNLSYVLSDVANVWDTTTDRLDFTSFNLGDAVDIRIDLDITTTSSNTVIELGIEIGIGGSPFTLVLGESYFKSTGTYEGVSYTGLYVGDTNFKDNPARIVAKSDSGVATVKVNGWYIKGLKRGLI